MTTGAFLLVILVGTVTLFKVVFMIFFLLFIFAYEVKVLIKIRITDPCSKKYVHTTDWKVLCLIRMTPAVLFKGN